MLIIGIIPPLVDRSVARSFGRLPVLAVGSRDAESAYDRVRLFDRARNLLHQSMCPCRTFVQRSLRPGNGGLETGEKPVEWSVKGSGEYLEGTVWGGLRMVHGPDQVVQASPQAANAAQRPCCGRAT